MSKRFAIVIGVAAAGVMALGAQPAAAVPKYDTRVTLFSDQTFVHGRVSSESGRCERRPHVGLFQKRPGADRTLRENARIVITNDGTMWTVGKPSIKRETRVGDLVYAKVHRQVRDGYTCRPDRSRRLTW